MSSFGASFGFAVMGRISLLIGRFTDLILFSGSDYHYATYWVLILIVGILGYAVYNEQENRVLPESDTLSSLNEEE